MNSSGMSTTRCSMGSSVWPRSSRVMIWGLPTSTSKPSRRIISMMMASWSSPLPETRKVSGESVSSTRMATLVRFSFHSRSRSCVEVTNFPSRPEKGETLEEKSMDTVGSSMCMTGSATGFSGSLTVSPISTFSMPATATISPAEAIEHGDLGALGGAVAMNHGHAIVLADLAVHHAPNDEATHVVVPVEGGGAELKPHLGIEARRWDGRHQRVEEGRERLGVVVEGELGDALARVGVEHGKLELLLRRVEVDEEIVDLVEDLCGARVLAVDLVDDHHRRQPRLQRLLEHEARLG